MSSSSTSSSESNSRATSKEDLKDLSTSTSINDEGKTARGLKCEKEGTVILGHFSSDVSPCKDQHCSKPSGTTEVRHRYRTHAQLIKEKLNQIKVEMQKISKVHLHQRPERKAYHPFVWNNLSPYRDTTEIDHLLTMTADPGRRNQ